LRSVPLQWYNFNEKKREEKRRKEKEKKGTEQ
jgi:hypothetical protein